MLLSKVTAKKRHYFKADLIAEHDVTREVDHSWRPERRILSRSPQTASTSFHKWGRAGRDSDAVMDGDFSPLVVLESISLSDVNLNPSVI